MVYLLDDLNTQVEVMEAIADKFHRTFSKAYLANGFLEENYLIHALQYNGLLDVYRDEDGYTIVYSNLHPFEIVSATCSMARCLVMRAKGLTSAGAVTEEECADYLNREWGLNVQVTA